METIHESAGTLLGRLWDLPGEMPSLIGGHHHFQGGGQENRKIATLHIAEAIAGRLGRGITPPGRPEFLLSTIDTTPADVVGLAQQTLDLNHEKLVHVIRAAEERLDAIR